jgi:hypothetical protein
MGKLDVIFFLTKTYAWSPLIGMWPMNMHIPTAQKYLGPVPIQMSV